MEEREDDQNIDIETEAEDNATGKLASLKEKLKVCETEKSEYLMGWQRERADFANWKKEANLRIQEDRKFMIGRVIEDLLPVLDSLEKAKSWSADLGFVGTQMEQVLAAHGLARYGDKGEKFDPALHETVGEIAVDKEEDDHKILEIESPGYKLGDRIIKAAKVKIGNYKNNSK